MAESDFREIGDDDRLLAEGSEFVPDTPSLLLDRVDYELEDMSIGYYESGEFVVAIDYNDPDYGHAGLRLWRLASDGEVTAFGAFGVGHPAGILLDGFTWSDGHSTSAADLFPGAAALVSRYETSASYLLTPTGVEQLAKVLENARPAPAA